MRIWHQSMTELDRFPRYRQALTDHIAAIVDPSVEVVLHGVRPGTFGTISPAEVLKYPFAFHRLLSQVIDHVTDAQDQGFDAVAMASYAEPFLREARSVVDIPVASMAESTLLTACSVARRSALITVSEDIVWMAERIIEGHGLERRVAGLYALSPPVNEFELVAAFDDPQHLLEVFTATARRAIAAHADVLIPAEGVLSEFLFSQGVRDVDGVSVMDGVGVTVMHAAMLGQLHTKTGLHSGRRWEYPTPPLGMLENLRSRADLPPAGSTVNS